MNSYDSSSTEPLGSYDHRNIKILSTEELNRFDFVYVQELAVKYSKSVEFVQRGVEACRLSGTSVEDHFIPKYLEGDKSIPSVPEMIEISKELQREARSQ